MKIPGEVLDVARAQDGLVTRVQALELGMSAAAIRHALGPGGSWQRLHRGVYATFTGPVQPRHRIRAAVLHSGPESMVTGSEACRAYGLRYVPDGGSLLVLAPNSVQREPHRGARVLRVRTMPEPRWISGIPVAPPERAILDACRGERSLRAVRALLCEAVQRGLTVPDRIRAELGAGRWRGSSLVRTVLGDLAAGCRSAPECELRDLVTRSAELPEPSWNTPLPGTDGEMLIPDACWVHAHVVVEIDSVEWHRYGDRPEETERRRARYAALGWTVIPVSPRRLREEPDAVLAQIEAAVRAGTDARRVIV